MLEKKKILLVDDDEELREIYASVFKNNGFEVLEARDGVEGADKATSGEIIDAIFTGVVMPRMDGFQMVEIIRKNVALVGVPVFISSHLGREEDRKRAEEMGLDGFFVKGTISPAQVCRKIQEKIREKEEKKQGKRYLLLLNPWELDGEVFIEENGFPGDLKCDNCGSALAIEVVARDRILSMPLIKCPQCGKKF